MSRSQGRVQVIISFLISFISTLALAQAPQIQEVPEYHVEQGGQLIVLPSLENAAAAGTVNWSKAYGHDDIAVNPVTGAVSWQIPSDMPSESFHLGLRASNLDGATVESFIIHVGVDKVVYIGPNEEIKSFRDAFIYWEEPGSLHRDPGITFIVRDGTYTGNGGKIGLTSGGWLQQPPNGTPSKYTTLMAENPGKTILADGGNLSVKAGFGDVKYIAFKGFHIEQGHIGVDGSICREIDCEPHHLKFIRNGVHMKHRSGGIGITRGNHILIENNYGYGGTRVRFGTYKASNVVFRRNIGRFDFDVEDTGPKNTFSFYTSMDIAGQNNIAIDADALEFLDSSEMAGEFGCPTTAGDSRISYDRSLQLNSDLLLSNFDSQNGAHCLAEVNDIISWDNRAPSGSFLSTRSASLINHATFGDVQFPQNPYVAFAGWPSTHARGIVNSVLHNFSHGPLFYGFLKGTANVQGQSLERFGIDTINLSSFTGQVIDGYTDVATETVTKVDPIWTKDNPSGGLRYLVRIEPNSNLSGKAKDGGDLGATITTHLGKSGTLWGEEGWNTETNVPAWPFPYQDVIAEKMRSMIHTGPTWSGVWTVKRDRGPDKTLTGDRGFARQNTNLTDYVWGYLGSVVPPMNVGAIGGDKSAVLRWDPQAPGARGEVTGYKVYEYDPDRKTISNPKSAGLKNSMTVEGLSNGRTYHFAVTAVTGRGESGYSYPVTVTAATAPKPLPPTVVAP